MRVARFVRTLGLLLLLGLAGSGGGCGPGAPAPHAKEQSEQIRESRKTAHQQLKEDARKAQEGARQQGAMRRDAHRGPAGR